MADKTEWRIPQQLFIQTITDLILQAVTSFRSPERRSLSREKTRLILLVVPFIRIKNLSITHNASNNTIVATFSLEPGSADVRLSRVRLYAWSDMYVGENVKNH